MTEDLQKKFAEAHSKTKAIVAGMPEGKQKAMMEFSLKQIEITVNAANDAVKYAERLKKNARIFAKTRNSYLGKVLAGAFMVRGLEMQKRMIAVQPLPKFQQGGCKMIEQLGPESIRTDIRISKINP